MREIKFRAKRLDNGEWAHGYYYQNYDIGADGITNQHFIVFHTRHHQTVHIQIDPDTLSEYTGLKDKNSKEIYEGDIDNHHGVVEWVIDYGNEKCGFFWKDEKGEYHHMDYLTTPIEIIGNIHDDPELLEESK